VCPREGNPFQVYWTAQDRTHQEFHQNRSETRVWLYGCPIWWPSQPQQVRPDRISWILIWNSNHPPVERTCSGRPRPQQNRLAQGRDRWRVTGFNLPTGNRRPPVPVYRTGLAGYRSEPDKFKFKFKLPRSTGSYRYTGRLDRFTGRFDRYTGRFDW